MVISVIGLGFVGVTTALALADRGSTVYGYDISERRRQVLEQGCVPFEEPGVTEALHRCLGNSFFIAPDLRQAVEKSDVVFFCVSTNAQPNGAVDLSHLSSAFCKAAEAVPIGKKSIFAIKSTVPPTTVQDFLGGIKQKCFSDKSIFLCSNPEFLREGYAWKDFNEADRVVIGTDSDRVREVMRQIYAPFSSPLCFVTPNTAEFIKYLSNSMLATMISFANEMAMIADQFGDIEIKRAFDILHMDGRFASGQIASYVHPGCGYGGYCLPKDVQAIAYAAGDRAVLLKDVIAINQKRQEYISRYIAEQMECSEGLAVLGLSFKPGSDDVRESVAANVIASLLEKGIGSICVYDPIAMGSFKESYPELTVTYAECAEAAMERAETVAILTAWKEFKELDYSGKKVLDFRYYL